MCKDEPQQAKTDPPGPHAVPELLAPAGDRAALDAALEAGASAVYFGLRLLNARRNARNFGQDEFARAVEAVHAHGAKAYLTLNIDLADRELEMAARILCFARQCGVDAVLVRDPALLWLKSAFPALEFHFSTQSCITSSADVRAAEALGIARVVLAREMTLPEIQAASAVPGIQTEVFVQGALCFSVSGRCLLSSWAGGRSGNRGACASPCRVPWTAEGDPLGTPLSMRDLLTVDRLSELRDAGVAALKIEGRMKNAAWVRRAVELYRRALSGERGPDLLDQAKNLGAYTGRELTSAYLDGRRDELTGVAGREAPTPDESGSMVDASESDRGSYDVDIDLGPGGIVCRCTCEGHSEEWTLPKTVVRRKHKAITVGQLLQWLSDQRMQGRPPGRLTTNDPGYLLVPRAVNGLVDRISATVHRANKRAKRLDGVPLPDDVVELLQPGNASGANRHPLGSTPDRVRLEPAAVAEFLAHRHPRGVIVEGLSEDAFDEVRRAARKVRLIVALPPVFFEGDIPRLRSLLDRCKQAKAVVEVNSWGGWVLAREAGVRMEGGPGLPVLNALAARKLADLGLRRVTLSVEADRRQLEEVTARCPVGCSMVVFARPALLTSRVELREEDFWDRMLVDRRDVRMRGRREGGLWVFRPVEPFDVRDLENDRIRVAHLVVDLVGSPDPVGEFDTPPAESESPLRFNYDRRLV